MFHDEAAETLAEFIPHPAKAGKACVLISFGSCRILNAPMNHLGLHRNGKVALLGCVADSNDVVEPLADEFLNRLTRAAALGPMP